MDRYTNQGYTEPDRSSNANLNQEAKDNMRRTAAEAGEKIRDESRGKAENAKRNAADRLDEYTQVTESIARTLHDEHHETLSGYVSEIAGYVGNISNNLREKSADDLMRDARNMARQNPALFIAGSVAIGLGIARLARTGGENAAQQHSHEDFSSHPSGSEKDAWSEHTPYIADTTRQPGGALGSPEPSSAAKEPFNEPI